jgi:hypothetical protein
MNKALHKKYQIKLYQIICEVMTIENDKQFEVYQSVLSMIYTLIENEQLNDIDMVLRVNFPNYYNSPVPIIYSKN